jgi:hypothetical protein
MKKLFIVSLLRSCAGDLWPGAAGLPTAQSQRNKNQNVAAAPHESTATAPLKRMSKVVSFMTMTSPEETCLVPKKFPSPNHLDQKKSTTRKTRRGFAAQPLAPVVSWRPMARRYAVSRRSTGKTPDGTGSPKRDCNAIGRYDIPETSELLLHLVATTHRMTGV